MRRHIAQRLRRFVDKHDPKPYATPATDGELSHDGSEFVVKLILHDRKTVVYKGHDAHQAVRAWEHQKRSKLVGRMEYWHNGVLRDTYTG